MEAPRRQRYRPVRTPTVLQMDAAECGAAALGIILEYHGRYVEFDVLRDECGVSRDGSNALYIKRAAQHHDLRTAAVRKPANELMSMQPPFIVFWQWNHFLVVEGFARRKVYLNDPAIGRRRVNFTEFEKSYSGIAFSFTPKPSFVTDDWWTISGPWLPRAVANPILALVLIALAGLALDRSAALALYTVASIPVSLWVWSWHLPVDDSSRSRR
jgi:ABC-type bacteriocin/lantibiotic exporter with double-glycine peptidase domain